MNDSTQRWPSWSRVGGTANVFPYERPALIATGFGTELNAFAVGFDRRIWWGQRFKTFGHYIWTWSVLGESWNVFPWQNLAAVRKAPGNVHVFAIGDDQNIWAAWKTTSWNGFFYLGTANNDFPLQDLAVVAKNNNHMDIFARGWDGYVYTAWQDDFVNGGQWTAPYLLKETSMHPSANIAATSISANHVQFFAVADWDETVTAAYPGPNGYWSILTWLSRP
jgi:hypothetical protein